MIAKLDGFSITKSAKPSIDPSAASH